MYSWKVVLSEAHFGLEVDGWSSHTERLHWMDYLHAGRPRRFTGTVSGNNFCFNEIFVRRTGDTGLQEVMKQSSMKSYKELSCARYSNVSDIHLHVYMKP